ncbi:hypothetical protein [Streptomyces sp. KR80]|uniref:hypothetical protein n=1 Tax=Streptomyces sp. KR80 TaxID=3457426 RepID=UPI003FD3708E
MRTASRAVLTSTALAGALLLASGCSGGEEETEQKVPKAATGTVEQLAAKVKCKPEMQIDAEELRQGICEMKDGKIVLATFTTNQGQQNWLSEAQNYGGSYLVGPKWVAVGEIKVLGSLRGRLGGQVEKSNAHGGAHGGHGGGGSHGGGGAHEDAEGSHGGAGSH